MEVVEVDGSGTSASAGQTEASKAFPTIASAVFPTTFPTTYSRFPNDFPTIFPTDFTTYAPDPRPNFRPVSRSRPVPSHQEIVNSHPVPSTKWLPTFPSHSHPAGNKRGPFPYRPSERPKKIRLRKARRPHPGSYGARPFSKNW